MPRYVNHEARRQKIIQASMSVISDSGLQGLSLRAVAVRLGGSTTLVTHYYATVKDLLDDLVARLVDSWDDELKALEAGVDDPHERLSALLTWLLPLTETARREERCRISLLADQLSGHEHRAVFDENERRIRTYLRDHLVELVPEDELELTIDVLRVVANGIVLSACEHPAKWTRRRQLTTMERALSEMGITG